MLNKCQINFLSILNWKCYSIHLRLPVRGCCKSRPVWNHSEIPELLRRPTTTTATTATAATTTTTTTTTATTTTTTTTTAATTKQQTINVQRQHPVWNNNCTTTPRPGTGIKCFSLQLKCYYSPLALIDQLICYFISFIQLFLSFIVINPFHKY